MQNCLSRKSSLSRKHSKTFRPKNCRVKKSSISRIDSKTFWPAKLSQLQIINIPKKTQSLFRLHNCLSRKSSISRNYSKTFSPADLSQPQIINIAEILKVFFACRNVLAANHQYPENAQSLFRMQNCLSRKSSISRKYSKTFLPAEMSQPQIINIPEISKDVFACRIVASANHQYASKIQRRFGLQNCLSCKSSISREKLKVFFACIIVLAASHQYPGNIQRLFRLQSCVSSKSLISRKYSKTFLPAELSQPQIVNIPKILKAFFACTIVLAANHQYPGNIQRLFRLQKYLSRKSSISRKYSKTYWPAELSQPHVISSPKIFEDFFACGIVLTANHQYPGNIQRLFRLQNCLSCKSLVFRIIQTFLPAELSQPQSINIPKILKAFFAWRIFLAASHWFPEIFRLFRLQNCLSCKSLVSRNIETFLPAELSQPQSIKIPKILKAFLACRFVLATNHQYPGNIQRLFRLQK